MALLIWTRQSLLVLVFIACSLLHMGFSPLQSHGQQADEEYYYHAAGQRIPLQLSTQYVAVKSGASGATSLAAAFPDLVAKEGMKHLSGHGILLYKLAPGVDQEQAADLTKSLRASASFELAGLVFDAPGAAMILTDRIIARFASHITEASAESIAMAHGATVLQKAGFGENVFLLEAKDGNGLDEANALHEEPDVIYAEPDFVRFMPKGHRMINKGASPSSGTLDLARAMTGPGALRRAAPFAATVPTVEGAAVSSAVIASEYFEAAISNVWTVSGSPTWAPDTYRAYSGSASGFCAGSTKDGPEDYDNDMDAWMVQGPFSLADAQDARVDLQAWVETESDFDKFSIWVSTNGTNYYGYSWWGDWAGNTNGEWMNLIYDLKRVYTLGNVVGEDQVWIALVFRSDGSIVYKGAYIDDVVIEKITGGYESLTNDTYDHLQWSLSNNGQLWGTPGADIDAPRAWNEADGTGVTVAIIDEGVDLTHPDLAGNLVTGYDATDKSLAGDAEGDDAHGTACGGIAAAITNNSLGVAGIAHGASIMPVRIAYDNGSGGWATQDSWIADGITWAVNNGADVLSNSWGGGSPSTAINDAFNHARTNGRDGKGCVVLVASGNSDGAVSYPATLEDVQAVGALSPCDERKAPTSCDGEYWWGSNFGSELDITAPGVHMYTTDIQGSRGYNTDADGDYFYNFNGTSSACPTAAGVAALIVGANPDLTAQQVESSLQQSADDLGTPGWDELTGFGRVNAARAVGAPMGGGYNPAYLLLK